MAFLSHLVVNFGETHINSFGKFFWVRFLECLLFLFTPYPVTFMRGRGLFEEGFRVIFIDFIM